MGPKQDGMNGGTTVLGEERSDEIRRDIEHTRNQMDRTLDKLDERLQPRNLLNDVLDWFQSSARSGSGQAAESLQSMGKTLVRQMRDNPVPTLLIGAGLAYLVFSNADDEDQSRPIRRHTEIDPDALEGTYSGSFVDARTGEPYDPEFLAAAEGHFEGDYDESEAAESEGLSSRLAGKASELSARAKEAGRDIGERAQATAASAQDTLSRAAESVSEVGRQAAHGVGRMADGARRAASSAGHSARRGSRQLSHSLRSGSARLGHSARSGYETSVDAFRRASDEYPFAVGLGFLAVGVLAGLAIPSTRQEDRWLGEQSDELKHRLREKGEELLDRGREMAENTVSVARDEAGSQGLTMGDLGEKVKRVASHVVESVTDAAREEGLAPDQLQKKAKEVAHAVQETAVNETRRHKEELTGSAQDESEKSEQTTGSCPLP